MGKFLTKTYWSNWFGKLFSLPVSLKFLSVVAMLGSSFVLVQKGLMSGTDYKSVCVLGVTPIILMREASKMDIVGRTKNLIKKVVDKK